MHARTHTCTHPHTHKHAPPSELKGMLDQEREDTKQQEFVLSKTLYKTL